MSKRQLVYENRVPATHRRVAGQGAESRNGVSKTRGGSEGRILLTWGLSCANRNNKPFRLEGTCRNMKVKTHPRGKRSDGIRRRNVCRPSWEARTASSTVCREKFLAGLGVRLGSRRVHPLLPYALWKSGSKHVEILNVFLHEIGSCLSRQQQQFP